MLRILLSLIIPAGLLGLAFYIHPRLVQLPPSQMMIVLLLPLAIALLTMGLCFRFNRSRLFFSALAVALGYALLLWYLPIATGPAAFITYDALCLLLPFSLLVYSLLQERGMFTWWGATRFAVLLAPLLLVAGIGYGKPAMMQGLLEYRFIDKDLSGMTGFTQPAMLMMLLATLVLNGRLFVQASAQGSALFGALLASLLMLYFKGNILAASTFASAATLMMAIAVIQESYSMAYIDQLTNLPGRRALDEQMMKLGGTYSIAMLDVDHFKKFNDRYGHDAGDEVLRMVASRIRSVSAGGKAFRYGGEEFSILFPGRPVEDVLEALDDVRERVGGSKFRLRSNDRRKKPGGKKAAGDRNVSVTISIGVAERSDRAPQPADVIKAADKALYKAKKQGRNRVCQ